MLVKQYAPFNDIRKGFDIVNAIINSVEEQTEPSAEQAVVDFSPHVNIRETEETYHIEVELPGVQKEAVDIQVDGDILTISGVKVFRDSVKEEEYRKVESSYGNFSRAFTLPKRVDTTKIEATFEIGILEVSIPKKELVDSSTKIEIK